MRLAEAAGSSEDTERRHDQIIKMVLVGQPVLQPDPLPGWHVLNHQGARDCLKQLSISNGIFVIFRGRPTGSLLVTILLVQVDSLAAALMATVSGVYPLRTVNIHLSFHGLLAISSRVSAEEAIMTKIGAPLLNGGPRAKVTPGLKYSWGRFSRRRTRRSLPPLYIKF